VQNFKIGNFRTFYENIKVEESEELIKIIVTSIKTAEKKMK